MYTVCTTLATFGASEDGLVKMELVPLDNHFTVIQNLKVERCTIDTDFPNKRAWRKELLELSIQSPLLPADEVHLQLYDRQHRNWDRQIPNSYIILTQDNFCGIDVCKRTLALLYKTESEKVSCLVLKSSSRSESPMVALKNKILECLLAAEQTYEHVTMCPSHKVNLYILKQRVAICSLIKRPGVYPACLWDHSLLSQRYSYYQGGADNINVFKITREKKALIKTMTVSQSERIHTTFQTFLSKVLKEQESKDLIVSDGLSVDMKEKREKEDDERINHEVVNSNTRNLSANTQERKDETDENRSGTPVQEVERQEEKFKRIEIITQGEEDGTLEQNVEAPKEETKTLEQKAEAVGLKEETSDNMETMEENMEKPEQNMETSEKNMKTSEQDCCCPECLKCFGIPPSMALNNKNYANTRKYENTMEMNHQIAFQKPERPPPPVPEKTYKRDFPFNQLTDVQLLMFKVAERSNTYQKYVTFEELHNISQLLSLRCPLGKDWRELVQYIELDDLKVIADIENICRWTDKLPGYLMLMLWFQLRPMECTRKRLKEVLVEMGRRDIVIRVFGNDKDDYKEDDKTWELYL